ncbi:ABC-type nitrate/sulfonate/bicarbonate transport systems, periplasmic components [Salinisphaera sp. LB1]|nr:ABC-type nitrate/sulfonate/bicarbonate transport systems, periplasmic components [Salinisphaera sp. LB1]
MALGLFAALAGCGQSNTDQATNDSGSGGQPAKVKAQIGYMPILPDAQLFVNLENGGIAKAGIDPDLVSFQNGPAMVQALASGQLDIAYFGIGPTMVARAKGADIRVVASNIIQQISVVALGDLAPYFNNGDPATAFARFRKDTGHKAKISTFPVGSVPQTVFAYWLKNKLHADASDVDVIYQGASQVQQSLLTGAVDGAAILEPIVSIVEKRQPKARVVASGADLFDNQPGAVVAVRQAFIKAHPKVVERLVAAHIRATQTLVAVDGSAIDAVAKYVGGGRLPRDIVASALDHSKSNFVADPHRIVDATQRMYHFQRAQGTLKAKLDIGALFDTTFYDRVVGKTSGADGASNDTHGG